MDKRLKAWHCAKRMVDSIVGDTEIKERNHGGNLVSSAWTESPYEQRLSMIRGLAEWLLENNDEL